MATPFRIFAALRRLAPVSSAGFGLWLAMLLLGPLLAIQANAVIADVFNAQLLPNAQTFVQSIAVQPDGQVLIGGSFSGYGGYAGYSGYTNLARLSPDGGLDTTFKTVETDGVVYGITVLPNVQILIVGSFGKIRSSTQAVGTGTIRRGIALLNADGSLDPSFNPDATANGSQGNVFRAIRLASGKYLVGGHFTSIGGIARSKLARLNSNGSVDTTFNAGTMNLNDYVWNFAELPDGNLMICGGFTQMGGQARVNVARLTPDGFADAGFHADVTYAGGGYASVNTVIPQANGSVVITGAFDQVKGVSRTNLARLGSDGTPDGYATYVQTNAAIHWAVPQPDGAVVFGGSFTLIGGLPGYAKMARITMNGNLDHSFVPPSITGGDIYSLARQTDGKILLGGSFANVDNADNAARPYLARVHGATLTPVHDVAEVTLGSYHYCLLNTAAKTECWGSNDVKQLGNRSIPSDPVPHLVPGIPDGMLAISPSNLSPCVLTPAHGVKCWGSNEFGQIGDGTTVTRSDPTDVIGLSSGVRAVHAGEEHQCAVMTTGSVQCWGHNNAGQLGDGTTTNATTPVSVQGLGTTVEKLALGLLHSCAITTAGGVLCWGANAIGQLGNGEQHGSLSPVPVVGLPSAVMSISATDYGMCALIDTGAVMCWGRINGIVESAPVRVPTAVSSLGTDVMAIGGSDNHMCAVTHAGALKCWGYNGNGELGDGTTTPRAEPVDVVGLGSGVRMVVAEVQNTCALTDTNALYCWGFGLSHVPAEVLRYAFNVTTLADGGGSLSPTGSHLVDAGTQEHFTVAADPGHHLIGVDGSCGGTRSGSVYTTAVIGIDCTIAAHFTIDTFTVTPSVVGGHGTITPATSQTIAIGSTTTFTLASDPGYHATVAGTCGGSLSGNVYTINPITSDCTVIASFGIDTFTVTPSVDGGHGTIAPDTAQTINFGSTATFTLVPDIGYHASIAGTCAGTLSGTVYTTNAITSDCSVIASFVIDTYTVTPSVTGGHGTITPATPQTINFGATIAFTLTPESGHVGSVGGTCGGTLAGNVYTSHAIVADCAVIASFPSVQSTLSISDSRDYARYGKTLNYLVTVLNTGATDLTGTISGALPATLDSTATQWICVEPGVGVQCTPAGTGALIDSVTLPAGRSVNWLVSAPVRQDAQGPTVDYAVHFDSAQLPAPLDSIDTDTLVIFRNSFDHEYDDGANAAPAVPLDTEKVIQQVVPPAPAATTQLIDPLVTVTRGNNGLRVELLTFAAQTWIRLVTMNDRCLERTSAWINSDVGADYAIAIGVDDAGDRWLLDTGVRSLEIARPKPSADSAELGRQWGRAIAQ